MGLILEVPAMIAISWFVWGWVARSFEVPRELRARFTAGATAFTLLMVAENLLARVLSGQSATEYLAAYRTPARAIGLAAQVLFALMPVIQQPRIR
jgi:hypothetical protein